MTLFFRARVVLGALIFYGVATAVALAAAPVPQPPARFSDLARPIAYDLQLALVPAADRYSGRVAIDVDITSPTQILWLDAVGLDVHRAFLTIGSRNIAAKVLMTKEAIGLRFPQAIPAGHATIVVEYDASFERQSQNGLIKIKEQDAWFIASNFEPDYARQMVPSFDELRAKATWRVTLDVPVGVGAFSNAPQVSEELLSSTMKRIRFAPTAPMSTYLLALAVGPFDIVDGGKAGRRGTPIRILVPHGMAASARFAAESTGRILDLTEDYVGQPYPYDKLDIVALPGVDTFGAMENIGLIINQADLVLAPGAHETPWFQQQYVLNEAHEIAHMWFGNWLAPATWGDLWLNEGFATWLSQKTLARFNPAWQQGLQNDEDRATALYADRLLAVHPLRTPGDSAELAESAFDAITYSKGAAVLRMAEHWIGEDRFRDGVRHYLQAHPNGNVASEDLFAALTAAADLHMAPDVTPMLKGFTEQPGAPALEVGLMCGDSPSAPVRLDLNQLRFAPRAHIAPALPQAIVPAAEHWLLPVCFQYGQGGDFGETCTTVRDPHMVLPLPDGERCPSWVIANTDGWSYLIPLLRDPLTAHLSDAPLLPAEAVPVLNDARILISSDAVGADQALGLAARFSDNRQPLVVLASLRLARALPRGLIEAADAGENFAKFVQHNYGARAERLGWQIKGGEREVDDFLRMELVPFVADVGEDGQLRSDADRLAREALAGRVELGPMLNEILNQAAKDGGQDLYDSLLLAGAKAPALQRQAIYGALGRFRDTHLLDASLDLALSERLDVRDAAFIMEGAGANEAASAHIAQYVETHFEAFGKRFGSDADFLAAAEKNLCDKQVRGDLETFISEHAAKMPQLRYKFGDTLERAALCEAGRQIQVPRLKLFFAGS
jgi:cytosol alanyl aminopeptidase